jgi:hypothetical protein
MENKTLNLLKKIEKKFSLKKIERKFSLKKIKKKSTIIEDNQQTTKHVCNNCRINEAIYIRKLNVQKVPDKYFLDSNDICSRLIVKNHGINYNEKNHFINFPKEYVLSKYDYYLCEDCHVSSMDNDNMLQWTEWIKI